ncbi:MAG: SDR family NAD(P)-dependent oxidoreductase [Alphaproteobacteria bacterium]|nr:SDR family NAD(P)-dependent oxidoreductase [Alphaproteobacteria bacterium]
MMTSFPEKSEAVVIGASGGIGSAITALLAADQRFDTVHAFARQDLMATAEGVRVGHIDITDEASIEAAAASVTAPRLVFVATGLLHQGDQGPEKSWRSLDPNWLDQVMRVNASGPGLVAKHFLPKLPREEKAVFAAISARVGSISDNALGGWYGYRASKAALNMLMKSLSIELARSHKDACVFILHPGTVATNLSAPFQKGVPDHKLFSAPYAAERLLTVVNDATASQTGSLIAWDGQTIPF